MSGLMTAAFFGLILLVALSPHHFVYDEAAYTNYVPLFHVYGFSIDYLNSLNGASGPLHALVQIVFEGATRLDPVAMRWVNIGLFALMVAILAAWFKHKKVTGSYIAAASVVIVPMTWVVGGMALTEMVPMVLVTLSLCFQLRGLEMLAERRPVILWYLASGALLGLALWGRQTYFVLAGVPVLTALLDSRLRIPALSFVVVVVALFSPLIYIWQGLVPPSQHHMQEGISLVNGLISLGYTAICFQLLIPRGGWMPLKVWVASIALTFAANAWWGPFVLYPVRSLIERHLPSYALIPYGIVCGSLFLSCGVVFLTLMLRIFWDNRENLSLVTIYAGLLCMAIAPALIVHQYSSRYTALSLPYLILAVQPLREWRLKTCFAAAVGGGLGYLSLRDYFLL
jgi:hypothetical protein